MTVRQPDSVTFDPPLPSMFSFEIIRVPESQGLLAPPEINTNLQSDLPTCILADIFKDNDSDVQITMGNKFTWVAVRVVKLLYRINIEIHFAQTNEELRHYQQIFSQSEGVALLYHFFASVCGPDTLHADDASQPASAQWSFSQFQALQMSADIRQTVPPELYPLRAYQPFR